MTENNRGQSRLLPLGQLLDGDLLHVALTREVGKLDVAWQLRIAGAPPSATPLAIKYRVAITSGITWTAHLVALSDSQDLEPSAHACMPGPCDLRAAASANISMAPLSIARLFWRCPARL